MLLIALAAAALSPAYAHPQRPAAARPPERVLSKGAAGKSATTQLATLPVLTLLPVTRSARPGNVDAAATRAALTMRNTAIRRKYATPALVTAVAGTVAGVTRVNDVVRGAFEPGGTYAITGSGFGREGGYAFLRSDRSILPMVIVAWSDALIMAKVADDISGIEDLDRIQLAVTPEGKAAFTWSRYGFRAARADVTLPIADGMFRSDPRQQRLPNGSSFTVQTGPGLKEIVAEYLKVTRRSSDDEGQKRCVEPGIDRVRWNVALRRGFEVTGYHLSHVPHRTNPPETARGRYAAAWDGDDLRINYGVTRFYDPPGMWRSATGACWSIYSVRLIATGPRGLSPLP